MNSLDCDEDSSVNSITISIQQNGQHFKSSTPNTDVLHQHANIVHIPTLHQQQQQQRQQTSMQLHNTSHHPITRDTSGYNKTPVVTPSSVTDARNNERGKEHTTFDNKKTQQPIR